MLRNSYKDQRKGDKLVKRPYAVEEYLGKGIILEQGKCLKNVLVFAD